MLDLDNIDFKTVDVTVDEDGNGWLIDDSSTNKFGGDTGIDADYEAMEAAMADMEADMMDEDIRWADELENN